MGKIVATISISLDGFITGPSDEESNGLGDGGMVLHDWLGRGERDPRTVDVLAEAFNAMGAMIMGRHSFEVASEAWGEEPPFRVPVFVMTHRPRPADERTGTTFTFVESFEAAVAAAQAAAGDQEIELHGATSIQQAINAGVLDELQLHVVPVLLGDGKRLLANLDQAPVSWEQIRVIEGAGVTHLKYRVR
jgi:dihydrofolate reductase